MSKNLKFLLAVVGATFVAIAINVFFSKFVPAVGFAGFQLETVNAIGTASSPVTLTSSYNGNSTTITIANQEYLSLNVDYTPTVANSYMQILVQVSRDGGVTYRPWGSTQIATSSINIFSGPSSTFQGVPVVYPADGTTVSGTLYRTSEPNFDIVATHIRILAREVTTGSFGTAFISATLSSKR